MGLFSFLRKTDINEAIVQYQKTEDAVLLDVRTNEEYRAGHIPGSVNIPVEQIMTAPDVLKDRNVHIFSYCLRGSRSHRAVSALRRMGYTDVTNIGGIAAYRGEIIRG